MQDAEAHLQASLSMARIPLKAVSRFSACLTAVSAPVWPACRAVTYRKHWQLSAAGQNLLRHSVALEAC